MTEIRDRKEIEQETEPEFLRRIPEPPQNRSMFRRYAIADEEQKREALQKTPEYVATSKRRKVVRRTDEKHGQFTDNQAIHGQRTCCK